MILHAAFRVPLNEEWRELREQSHAYSTFDVSTSQLCVRGHHKMSVWKPNQSHPLSPWVILLYPTVHLRLLQLWEFVFTAHTHTHTRNVILKCIYI